MVRDARGRQLTPGTVVVFPSSLFFKEGIAEGTVTKITPQLSLPGDHAGNQPIEVIEIAVTCRLGVPSAGVSVSSIHVVEQPKEVVQ